MNYGLKNILKKCIFSNVLTIIMTLFDISRIEYDSTIKQKIIKLYLRCHTLRSDRFVAEVAFIKIDITWQQKLNFNSFPRKLKIFSKFILNSFETNLKKWNMSRIFENFSVKILLWNFKKRLVISWSTHQHLVICFEFRD